MGDDGFLTDKLKKKNENSVLKVEAGEDFSEMELPELKLGEVLKSEMKKNLIAHMTIKHFGTQGQRLTPSTLVGL